MSYSGFILAGGKSSRMGTDKGLVKINDQFMVDYSIKCLKSAGIKKIAIIANNDTYKQFGVPVYKDLEHEKGPLGGIYTALNYSETEDNIILSCDVPFLSPSVIKALMKHGGIFPSTTVYYKGELHCLIAGYKKSVLDTLKNELDNNNLKVRRFIQKCGVHVIDIEKYTKKLSPDCFNNINSKNDLNRANYGM